MTNEGRLSEPELDEQLLEGGHRNEVVRVGNTVRRTCGAWTPTVQRLLAHVRAHATASFDVASAVWAFEAREPRERFLDG